MKSGHTNLQHVIGSALWDENSKKTRLFQSISLGFGIQCQEYLFPWTLKSIIVRFRTKAKGEIDIDST